MSAPTSVRYAAYAVWAIVAIGVVRTVLTFAMRDTLIDAWIAASPGRRALPREVVAGGAPSYAGVALIALAFAALLAVAAYFLLKGANWARITAVVFSVLTFLGGVVALVTPSLLILQALNILTALLSVAVVVLLFGREANRHFKPEADNESAPA